MPLKAFKSAFDEDAPSLIDGWLSELEREGMVRRYTVGSRRLPRYP